MDPGFSLDASTALTAGVFLGLTILLSLRRGLGVRLPLEPCLGCLWSFFLVFAITEAVSFEVGVWFLIIPCFTALREYFSHIDIRPEDRFAILGAYLTIPFMVSFIRTDWYGMFIISVPVYGFLAIPFLVALGGRKPRGSVFSIGAINFGLFLFVYCIGHIGYLARVSTWRAIYVVLAIFLSDLVSQALLAGMRAGPLRMVADLAVCAPATMALGWVMGDAALVPLPHALILGVLIPVLASTGRFTISHIEADLGIAHRTLSPGRGQVIDALRSFLYAAPVTFHYLRYYVS